VWCLSHHGCNLIAPEAHDLFAENRLVRNDQAVSVYRHIPSSEHSHDTRMISGPAGINLFDLGMGILREFYLHVQHARYMEIIGEFGFTSDFLYRILTRYRAPNHNYLFRT